MIIRHQRTSRMRRWDVPPSSADLEMIRESAAHTTSSSAAVSRFADETAERKVELVLTMVRKETTTRGGCTCRGSVS